MSSVSNGLNGSGGQSGNLPVVSTYAFRQIMQLQRMETTSAQLTFGQQNAARRTNGSNAKAAAQRPHK
ncbi:MAG: hypothetical protein WBA67_15775 [Jannaschia sp.]